MSEFRQNFATKEWVIIAPGRSARPNDFRNQASRVTEARPHRGDCPFCPGNEQQTGRETFRIANGSGWDVRIVQNKFAALDPAKSTTRHQHGRFLKSDSYGVAEIVIESPVHDETLTSMPMNRVQHVLRAYKERSAEIGRLKNMAIVMLFRNYGPGAGTSLEHPHAQIIGSPIIPPHIRDPFQKAALHYDSFGTCVYCDLLAEELRQAERIIASNEHFVSFCPYASRTPFEIRIYPRRHNASFTWVSEAELAAFASLLQTTLYRIGVVLGNPSYNFVIRSSPVGDEDVRYLHWYFLLIPKITTPAGFEIGSGIYINPVAPEDCAEQLRRADGQ